MKQIPIQVHDYKTRYGNALRSLKSAPLPKQDIEDVISFVHYCAAEQVSIALQVKYLVQVKVAAEASKIGIVTPRCR